VLSLFCAGFAPLGNKVLVHIEEYENGKIDRVLSRKRPKEINSFKAGNKL
jgi:hypothetical protein